MDDLNIHGFTRGLLVRLAPYCPDCYNTATLLE